MFHVCLCCTVLSASCSLVINCWERADLLDLLCVAFFVTFPYGVPGLVWYLIVTMPDICLCLYFDLNTSKENSIKFLVYKRVWVGYND